jgi:hypothetical protein
MNYNDVLNKKVKKALGDSFKDYQSISYPTNNFGLVTCYLPQGGESKPKDKDFLCDTWECLGLSEAIPTDQAKQLSINDFAAVGGAGADISLEETDKSDIGFKALLPKIASILNIGGGFDKSKTVISDLQLGRFFPRLLRRERFVTFVNGLPPGSMMKTGFAQGRLIVVVGDVVSTGMKIQIKADSNTGTNIDAKLGPGTGTGVSKVFSDSTFGFKLSKQTTGEYNFEVTSPVVALRLAKRQPGAGVLGQHDDWTDWPTIQLPKV